MVRGGLSSVLIFKIIGSFAIFLSFLLMGFTRVFVLRERNRFMKEMKRCLFTLKSEISLKQIPLSAAFKNTGQIHKNKYFVICSEKIEKIGATAAYRNVFETAAEDYTLSEAEKEAVFSLSDGLGKKELCNQLAQIDFAAQLCGECSKLTDEELKNRAGLILRMSAFIGAAVVIVLL